jgi:hypothetical protein
MTQGRTIPHPDFENTTKHISGETKERRTDQERRRKGPRAPGAFRGPRGQRQTKPHRGYTRDAARVLRAPPWEPYLVFFFFKFFFCNAG